MFSGQDSTAARRWALGGVALIAAVSSVALSTQWIADSGIGGRDFRAYWAASRLLLDGRNPCNPDNLLEVEQANYDPNQDYTVMAWNPPTMWVLLLPLALLPLHLARSIWFLINLALILGSGLTAALMFLRRDQPVPVAAYLALCCFFPPVLSAVFMGQITFFVVFGVIATVKLIENGRWFWAGVALSLTSVKPHLVLLLGPYLLIYALMRRKWAMLVGLGAAALVCAILLFALRPQWVSDYLGLLEAPPMGWETTTVGGLFVHLGAPRWVQFLGIGLLLLLPFFLAGGRPMPLDTAVGTLILLTLPLTFFGWSYDQSLLLVPLAQIAGWLSGAHRRSGWWVVILASSLAALVANLLHSASRGNNVYLLWVPLVWAVIYLVAMVTIGGQDADDFKAAFASAASAMGLVKTGRVDGTSSL